MGVGDQYKNGFGRPFVIYSAGPTNKGIDFTNNVFDYLYEIGGPIYPTTRKGLDAWSGNYRLHDAAQINNPGNT
ncbi:hypothetical protein ES708_22484 [subsurface metagenome]